MQNISGWVGRSRPLLAQSLALFAAVVMIDAAPRIAAEQPFGADGRSEWIMLFGMLSLWAALWLAKNTPPQAAVATAGSDALPMSMSKRWARYGAVMVAVVVMLALVEVNGRFTSIDSFESMSHHLQFALLLVACLLLVWGLSDRSLRLPRWRDISRTRWLEVCLVAGLTLAALVLRLHDLEAIRAFVDELNFVLPARRFSVEADVPLLQPMSSIAAFPIIYPYFQSVASAAVESGLIGLRIPSAVFGALTVPALYFLGKQLFDWRTGLVAAVLLLSFPVHLQWSRLGMNNVADPLFGVLMLALLVRGVRRGGTWHFALAGIFLGFTQYFYEGGRLVFLAVTGVWFICLMLSTTWRSLPRRYIVVFLASALIIGGPIYLTLIGMDRPLTARFE